MGRRELLTEDERTLLFGVPVDEAGLARYYTLTPEDLELLLAKRGARNALGAAVQLGLLRYPGFGLVNNDTAAPEALVRYLASQLNVQASAYRQYAVRTETRREHARELAELLGLRHSVRGDLPVLIRQAAEAAAATDKGATIVGAILQGIRTAKIILPPPDMIERVGLAGRALARKEAAATLIAVLTPAQLASLDTLLENDASLKRTPLAWLRDIPEAPGASNLNDIIERLAYVRKMQIDPKAALRIHEHRFRQLAREGAVAPAFLLSDYSLRRRRATLTAQTIDFETRLSDTAIEMFDKLIGSLFTKANKRKERRIHASTRDVGRLMRLFDQTIGALTEARAKDSDPFAIIDDAVGWRRLLDAKPQVKALAEMVNEDVLITAAEKYSGYRKYVPAFLDSFEFKATNPKNPVLAAVKVLRDLNHSGQRDVPADAPMPFTSKQWKQLVMETGKPDRRRYETAVLATLRDRLRSGDVWVDGTRNYQRFDEYLLPLDDVATAAAALPITTDVDAYLSERAKTLDFKLRRFERLLLKGKLQGVELRDGKLHVTPLTAITPPEADKLGQVLADMQPKVRITELLNDAHRMTGFADCFTDLRSGRPHKDPNVTLAAILADASNLGVEKMADASQGVSYAQLAWAHSWYLSEDNYRAALAKIINSQNTLPLAAAWGTGTTSSSDGLYFQAGRRGGGHGSINAKYGTDPGVLFYTHVSDQYGPFSSKVISATTGEAPHVLDGLMHHGTSLEIKEHYTDTGGATDHVFGLCHLLGFRFAPRLRDIRDRRLGTIEPISEYKGLEPMLGLPIRVDLIRECWDDIIRLAASIKAGTVAPSVMLKKLSSFQRQNRLHLALQEIGRIERTLFTMDWLESMELRRRCQAGLNKGEARHFLAHAIFVHRQGRITDRTYENQTYRASGLNLVIAAIVHWNTVYMERAVAHLRSTGGTVPDELLAHTSPLGWSHISLTGDYLWEQAAVAVDGFRPLNTARSRLKLVA